MGKPNKPAILECYSASGTGSDLLTYSGAGTGITFNNGPGAVANGPSGSGILNCNFAASNNHATLLYLGGSNGAEGNYIHGSKFSGGGLTIGLGNNTRDVKLDQVKIYSGVQSFATSGSVNAGENIQLDHVAFLSSQTFTNGVTFGGGSSGRMPHEQVCQMLQPWNTQLKSVWLTAWQLSRTSSNGAHHCPS